MQDINELELPKTCKTEFPDPDDLLSFKLMIFPDEGFYRNGQFIFSFKIGAAYPHEPPKVFAQKNLWLSCARTTKFIFTCRSSVKQRSTIPTSTSRATSVSTY